MRRGIQESIIVSYSSERRITLEVENPSKQRIVESGIAQGTVLGPTWENKRYDSLLKMIVPH